MTQKVFSQLLGVNYDTHKNWEIEYRRRPTSPALSLLLIASTHPEVFTKYDF